MSHRRLLDGLRGARESVLGTVAALEARADPTAAPALAELLFQGDPEVARAGLCALGALVLPPESWTPCRLALAAPGERLREAVVELLGASGEPAAATLLLVELGRAPAGQRRVSVLEALHRLWPGPDTPPADARAVDYAWPGEEDQQGTEELVVRLEAGNLGALASRPVRWGRLARGRAVERRLRAWLRGEDRGRAVWASRLFRLGAKSWSPEARARGYRDAHPEDRPALAEARRRLGDRDFLVELREELATDDLRRVRLAARALGLAGDPEDADPLLARLRAAPDEATASLWDALGLLLERHPAAAGARTAKLDAALGRAAGAPDVEVRRAAVRVLGSRGAGRERLVPFTRDPDPGVRLTALRMTLLERYSP